MLFWAIVIIFMGSMITAFVTSYTIWPFFSYSLYAYPEKDRITYPSAEIILNGEKFDFYKSLPVAIAVTLENEANNYIYLKSHNYTDQFYQKLIDKRNIHLPGFLDPIFKYKNLNDQNFATWMKNFIALNYDIKIKSIQLNEIGIGYNPYAHIKFRKNIFIENFN